MYLINARGTLYTSPFPLCTCSTSVYLVNAGGGGIYLINAGDIIYITLSPPPLSQEVVEAINEFAFVKSDYPLVLSIENHCKKYSGLIKRMATLFTIIFGDKLVKEPFDDIPVRLCVCPSHVCVCVYVCVWGGGGGGAFPPCFTAMLPPINHLRTN